MSIFDYLIFIDELKALMTENVSNTYVEDINKLIRKYEKKVSDFESAYAPKEVDLSTNSNQTA